MSKFPSITLISLTGAFVVAGCGSGTDASGTSPPAATPMAQTTAGTWEGEGVIIGGVSHEIDCLVAPTMQVSCRLYIDDFVLVAAIQGILEVDGLNVTGSGKIYSAPGRTLADSSMVADMTISSGSVSEFNFLNLDVSAAGVHFFAVMEYNPELHDRGSALNEIAGPYATYRMFGDASSFSIDFDGSVMSQSSSGCVCNGQVGIIDPTGNVYSISMNVSNCATLDGSYVGLGMTRVAVVRDNEEFGDPTANDVFTFTVYSNQTLIDGRASR